MKNLFLLSIILTSFSCKAQQTLPLNTNYEEVPNNAYVKDLNHELDPYIGTYKAIYQGNEITLYITKEDKMLKDYGTGDKKYYKDVLHVKYIVKKISTGIILQDNQNPIDPKRNKITSMRTNVLDNNSISFYYSGTNCGIGYGEIKLKKINTTQIRWSYYPNDSLFSDGDCPNNLDKKIYLPETDNLIFTKQ